MFGVEAARNDGFTKYYVGTIALDLVGALLFGRCDLCLRGHVDNPDRSARVSPPSRPFTDVELECIHAGQATSQAMIPSFADYGVVAAMRNHWQLGIKDLCVGGGWNAEARRCVAKAFTQEAMLGCVSPGNLTVSQSEAILKLMEETKGYMKK